VKEEEEKDDDDDDDDDDVKLLSTRVLSKNGPRRM